MSEKIKKLLGAGFFDVFGASLINNVINFLAGFILVRILSKSEYGLFTYVWNKYNLVMLLCGLGYESGFLQLASEKSKDTELVKKLYGYSSRIGAIFNIAVTALLVIIALFIPLKIKNSNGLLLMVAFLPSIQFIFRMMSVYLRSLKRNRDYAILTNINTLLIGFTTVAGAYVFREKGLILAYYVSFALTIILAIVIIKVPVYLNGTPEKDDAIQLRNISIISLCNNALSQLLYLFDVFVIGVVIANEEILATYKVATIIPTAMMFVPQSVIVFVYPYFAEHRLDKKWCISNFKKLMVYFNLANIVITTMLVAGAPIIIRLVHGAKYLDAVPAFRILSLSYFFSAGFKSISGNLLVTQRKLKYNLFVSIMTGVVNIITDYILVSYMGSIGAAYTTLAVVILAGLLMTPYLLYSFNHIKEDAEDKLLEESKE